MQEEVDNIVVSLRDQIKDSTGKTHKMLIDNLSGLTVYLERESQCVGPV